ncbi:flagellar hook-basal body complex protein FliE [Shimia haliotis]|uniref:Flagellar hook-basal body complex protein FliE n=1 Tax=Shimia haliotis TaxID=1280847 RepID=A0A1I4DDD7_9RHOB|nr:flagellar hook-basal body complex protein FliE [Shimia haliotis]SFK91013.1 flagellar hook-basal body complex protein FliE [Shimia haliotis]
MDVSTVLAAQKYTASKPATGPAEGGSTPTQTAFAGFAQEFASTLRESESVAMASMTGDADAHTLVQALAQTELAVETAVTVRDKVVEAYKSILNMPV